MRKFVTVRDFKPEYFADGEYTSIRDIVIRINKVCPKNNIFADLDESGQIRYYTAADVHEEIMNLGDGLIAEGLLGKHMAIVSDNSVRYVLADMTISSGAGVVTPIDKDAPDTLMETLFKKADIDVVFCGAKYVRKVARIAENCPLIGTIITMDKPVEGYRCWDELVAEGAALKDRSVFRTLEMDLDAPAKILFTSGTTGANKGVVLTSRNLAANAVNCLDVVKSVEGALNTSMSVLPMHHATEINTHIMARVASGDVTYINDSIRTMMTNIKIFKPGIITIVPMIANAFYKTIWANAEKAGKADKLRKGIKLSNLLRKFGIDITHKMFTDIYEAFGGNLYQIVCGGSMLNPVVVKGLNDIGIMMMNGYGITECGPLISMNADTLDEHLSVGKACPGLDAKIANPGEDGVGELCIRGASVSKGYYNDPEATAKAFAPDGFFNTGDSARIDSKGRIFLMGRKKNTIVLPSGKNICPEEVENVVETGIPYADEVVVYQAAFEQGGNSSDAIVCGLYIKDEEARKDRAAIEADIQKVNALLPSYKRIEYVEVPDTEYEKTSTKKIRRACLPAKCSGEGIKIL